MRDLRLHSQYEHAVIKLASVLGVVVATAVGLFGSWAVAAGYVFGRPLAAVPADIDLGTCEPGQPAEAQVEFVSLSDTRIQVVTGQSDCRCVTPRGLPVWVQPGERAARGSCSPSASVAWGFRPRLRTDAPTGAENNGV